jgi:ribonuclease D
MNDQWTWVDNTRQMLDAREHVIHSPLICLDTEYDSFRYFRERLCLIQLKAQNQTFLIDPFEDLDMKFIGDVFADTSVLKVMHAGDNDIRILKRDYGFEFNNIFDTQRAASILGSQYLSLAAVINQYLDIDFDKKKKVQRSRWDARPLSSEQLQYAAQDTLYLEPLYETLKQEIDEKGLLPELQKVLEDMAAVTWQEKPFDCTGFRHIKEYRCLTGHQKQSLKDLYAWRYQKAKKMNRAVFMILSDQDLIELCKSEPDSVDDLKVLGELSCAKVNCYGDEIIKIMKKDIPSNLIEA